MNHIDGLKKLRIISGDEKVMLNVRLTLYIFVAAIDWLRKVHIL